MFSQPERMCMLCMRPLPARNLLARMFLMEPLPICNTDRATCQQRFNARIGIDS